MISTPARTLVPGLMLLLAAALARAGETPAVDDAAKDLTLKTYGGQAVTLSDMTADGPVILVVLRGYPGYQCPICTRQVGDLVNHADAIKDAGARVLMVYPGPADDLGQRAQEFLGDRSLPAHFTLVTDPDYAFTNAYNLRWDAPKETAYPSTFVIDKAGKVRSATVSKSHGGRANAAEIVKALKGLR